VSASAEHGEDRGQQDSSHESRVQQDGARQAHADLLHLQRREGAELADYRVLASPSGATTKQEWSLPALGFGGVASMFLEPDPAVVWDDERIAAVRHALTSLGAPTT
jgi:hypothetical protein